MIQLMCLLPSRVILKGGPGMAFLFLVMVNVVAGIALYFIYKWLDNQYD